MQELVEAIQKVAKKGRTEEDLKIVMEARLRKYIQQQKAEEWRIPAPSYEVQTGFAGRRDAVYGHFTLEYKRPGYLNNAQNQEAAAQQLARYLEKVALETEDEQALTRVAGACTDGIRIFFMRYWPKELLETRQLYPRQKLPLFGSSVDRGGFQIIGPHKINEATLKELFRYLRALGRKPLVAEALSDAFGPNSEVAHKAVGALYNAITAKTTPKVAVLYQQWKHSFGIVYGEKTAEAEEDAASLAQSYGLRATIRFKPFLFTIHTYFALIMKLLAAEVLALQKGSFTRSILTELPSLENQALKARLAHLESGDVYQAHGIHNFLEGDFFRWYLDAWNDNIAEALQSIAQQLADFEPTTPTLQPGEARDILKKLYQYLVPRQLRRDLGEYYTPDWLAERLLNQLGYDGDPDLRLLDPACGSGTFLTLALARVREKMEFELWDRDPNKRKECAEKVLRNVVGFDLNPLAVIAARTNYLLTFGDLLRDAANVQIPIYNCDTILTPVLQQKAQAGQLKMFESDQDYFFLPTVVGKFCLPKAIIDQNILGYVTTVLEESIKNDYTDREFLKRIESVNLNEDESKMAAELYNKIAELEKQGKNGIWARLLKNSFAPILQGRFDMIAGNPPWVNWQQLPDSWRQLTKGLWAHYGLFTLEGYEQLLGSAKPDISMLFTYVCADHYLKSQGKLGFVITQTVFKSGAGNGFRRFRLGEKGAPLQVKTVDDLSGLQPFEGAVNRTAILTLIKGEQTRYPVPYTVWQEKAGQRITMESTLQEAGQKSRRRNQIAEPINEKEPTSPWISANRFILSALRKVAGESPYRARAGVCTWLNGAYWVQVLQQRADGMIVIENLGNIGRKKVPIVRAAVEPELLYPLLRGRDIQSWQASPEAFLLLPQDCKEGMGGYSESVMKIRFPGAYGYFKQFEQYLRQRSGFKRYFRPERDPFWSLYNVGPYTLAPYKTVWKGLASSMQAAVVSTEPLENTNSANLVVPEHNTMFVPCETPEEAHYLSAIFNSAVCSLFVASYIAIFYSAHVLENLRIPRFDPKNNTHLSLAELSQKAHQNASERKAASEGVNSLTAALWGINQKELKAIVQEVD